MLTKEQFNRYRKQIMLEDIGIEGQLLLSSARVLVIGAGGLGCPVLQYLTAAGVGSIGIVDFDVVELSNLHRQTLYEEEDLGKEKVTTAIKKLSAGNTSTSFIPYVVQINDNNAEELIKGYDLVIDGCDNFFTRYTVNDFCVKLNKPLVYGSILGYEGQIALFNYDGSRNLRDLFPDPPAEGEVPDCSENGVLGTTPGIIGTMMAQETIQLILKRPVLKNTLLLFNCREFVAAKIKF